MLQIVHFHSQFVQLLREKHLQHFWQPHVIFRFSVFPALQQKLFNLPSSHCSLIVCLPFSLRFFSIHRLKDISYLN